MSEERTYELSDEERVEFGYGKGGVPWYLLLYYLGFLTLFTWYVLEFQLPAFLQNSPGGDAVSVEASAE